MVDMMTKGAGQQKKPSDFDAFYFPVFSDWVEKITDLRDNTTEREP